MSSSNTSRSPRKRRCRNVTIQDPMAVVAALKAKSDAAELAKYFKGMVEALNDVGGCMQSYAGKEKLKSSLEGLVEAYKAEEEGRGITRSAETEAASAKKSRTEGQTEDTKAAGTGQE